MKELSIVIVSWNSCDLTLACLKSACQAAGELIDNRQRDVQIILVDNGSDDGTIERVQSLYPSVTALRLDRNVGFAAGANVGASHAHGEVILFLNTDAMISASACEAVLDHFDASPKTAVMGPQLMHPDGRLQNSAHAFPSLLDELVPGWLIDWVWPGRRPAKRKLGVDPRSVQAVQGAALFIRRHVFSELDGFSEDYFFYLEETDLCWRARALGWRVELFPAHRVVHLGGASSKQVDPAASRIEYHRALYRFLRLRRGAAVMWMAVFLRTFRGGLVAGGLGLGRLVGLGDRKRFAERSALLSWHLRGQPAGDGLAPSLFYAPNNTRVVR